MNGEATSEDDDYHHSSLKRKITVTRVSIIFPFLLSVVIETGAPVPFVSSRYGLERVPTFGVQRHNVAPSKYGHHYHIPYARRHFDREKRYRARGVVRRPSFLSLKVKNSRDSSIVVYAFDRVYPK